MSQTPKPTLKKQILGAAAGALVAFVVYQGYSYGSPHAQALLINAYDAFWNTDVSFSQTSGADADLMDRVARQRRRITDQYPTVGVSASAVAQAVSSSAESSSVITASSSSAASSVAAPIPAAVSSESSSEQSSSEDPYEPILDDPVDEPIPEDPVIPPTEDDIAGEQLQAMVESEGRKPPLPNSGIDLAVITMVSAGLASAYRQSKYGRGKKTK